MSDIFFFSITSAALVLSVMGLLFTAAMPAFDHWSKRFFQYYFLVFILCCLISFADLLLFGYPIPRAAAYLLVVLECLLLSLPQPMLTVYLLHCCGETMRRSKLLRTVLGLWAVYVVLLVSAELTGVLTYHVSDNYYYRGPLYPLMLLPIVAILLLNLAGVMRRRAQFSQKAFLSFLIAILPITAAMLAQMFADVFPLLDIGYVSSALAMYGLILSDQIEQSLSQQRENARLQTEIMLSQIQPHFLYNTLGAIQELCDSDPKAAGAATARFSRYLQGNMMSLAESGAIAFEVELKHTKAYLELEQLRFMDKLIVRYEITCTDFELPTLTLQPIAENAVWHGARGKKKGAGTVILASREYPDRWEITVTDDGPGFDPEAPTLRNDGRAHIGIQNVRERLRSISGGDLRIESEIGKGTKATIILPKKRGGGK